MEVNTEVIKAELTNGTVVYIEATALGGEHLVDFGLPPFKEVTDVVEGIAASMVASLQKVKPRKASVEFGLEIAVESGKLTAIVVKGSG